MTSCLDEAEDVEIIEDDAEVAEEEVSEDGIIDGPPVVEEVAAEGEEEEEAEEVEEVEEEAEVMEEGEQEEEAETEVVEEVVDEEHELIEEETPEDLQDEADPSGTSLETNLHFQVVLLLFCRSVFRMCSP